jgi:hypothetical protein
MFGVLALKFVILHIPFFYDTAVSTVDAGFGLTVVKRTAVSTCKQHGVVTNLRFYLKEGRKQTKQCIEF